MSREMVGADKGLLPTPKGKESMIEGVVLKPNKPFAPDPAFNNVKCYCYQEYGHKSNTPVPRGGTFTSLRGGWVLKMAT